MPASKGDGAAAFARDLGYLTPFLERLSAHAAGVPGAEGERLRALVSDEVARWREISALLGSAGEAGARGNPGPASPPRPPDEVAPALTVGSLKSRARRPGT